MQPRSATADRLKWKAFVLEQSFAVAAVKKRPTEALFMTCKCLCCGTKLEMESGFLLPKKLKTYYYNNPAIILSIDIFSASAL